MKTNVILLADSYKYSHHLQLPEGTTHSFSYIESRGGNFDKTLFFGLQMFIKEYLTTSITQEDINEAEALITAHGLPFNRKGWEHILNRCDGKLPVEIKAVAEGTLVPNKNVLVTIVNTDPEVPWLPSFLETALLKAVWYPTQVATTSYRIKQILKKFLTETGGIENIGFKLHDFGYRGVSSEQSAAIAGVSHLVNFMGTDTIPALLQARRHYDADMAGFSIPASEHSTMTVLGRNGEAAQMRNMVKQFSKPGSIYACVSDGFDIFNAAEKIWGDELKAEVIAGGGTLVIRPDSGNVVAVNTRLIKILDDKFGHTINAQGFKLLNNVRIIQGDGMDESSINAILMMITSMGYSADNFAFGMGGALLQNHHRDDNKWAMKCSAIKINGVWVDVFKDPITDPGKKSKKGLLNLIKENGEYKTVEIEHNAGWTDRPVGELRTVFKDGELLVNENLDTIRERANAQ